VCKRNCDANNPVCEFFDEHILHSDGFGTGGETYVATFIILHVFLA